ncbi:hypothetical protein [Cellulomonas bogoriensis]
MAHDLVVLIAAQVAVDERVLTHPVARSTFTGIEDGKAPFPDGGFPQDLVDVARAIVASGWRLWVAQLDASSALLGDGSIDLLREWDVDLTLLLPGR